MPTKTLNQVKTGEEFVCIEIPDLIKAELIRLGICEGNILTCISKIPQGPVVIRKDLSEIAIGNSYSKQIKVESKNAN